jgi:hypothetical protein
MLKSLSKPGAVELASLEVFFASSSSLDCGWKGITNEILISPDRTIPIRTNSREIAPAPRSRRTGLPQKAGEAVSKRQISSLARSPPPKKEGPRKWEDRIQIQAKGHADYASESALIQSREFRTTFSRRPWSWQWQVTHSCFSSGHEFSLSPIYHLLTLKYVLINVNTFIQTLLSIWLNFSVSNSLIFSLSQIFHSLLKLLQ